MSAGETIMEDVQFGDKGQLLNPNLHGYLVMTIKDAPEIFSGLVDSYEPRGPYGAKEVGEGSTLPVLGAVAHAIANATGVWMSRHDRLGTLQVCGLTLGRVCRPTDHPSCAAAALDHDVTSSPSWTRAITEVLTA